MGPGEIGDLLPQAERVESVALEGSDAIFVWLLALT